MAAATAVRITGSPSLRTNARSVLATPCSPSSSTRPVSARAQVEALTKMELEEPEWADQSCGAILSRIRSSTVSASGTRNSASARHISATPSWVDRPYSPRNASISFGSEEPRTLRTRSAATDEIAARCSVPSDAALASALSALSSSVR